MTSNDTLLPCPFCGSQAAWPEPEVNMNYVQCMSCSATANHAGEWNRRTPPTPATDEREAVARALIVAAGAELVASEKHWPETAAQYYTMCEKYQSYAASHGLVTDAFRNADAALSALAPIRAQEIAAARAEEQGYRHTQVAALKQVHAAEILAAEASERARIASNETAWLLERDYFGQLRYFSAACQDEAPTDWTPDNLQALRFARRIDAERFASREATDCIDIRVVEHMWCANEHGAGK